MHGNKAGFASRQNLCRQHTPLVVHMQAVHAGALRGRPGGRAPVRAQQRAAQRQR
jgi:hypothetical protein